MSQSSSLCSFLCHPVTFSSYQIFSPAPCVQPPSFCTKCVVFTATACCEFIWSDQPCHCGIHIRHFMQISRDGRWHCLWNSGHEFYIYVAYRPVESALSLCRVTVNFRGKIWLVSKLTIIFALICKRACHYFHVVSSVGVVVPVLLKILFFLHKTPRRLCTSLNL
jgi:hypothetical protein